METLHTIITFNYPAEAYPLMSLLESEGIECYLKDEINVQMYSLSSTALGGVKLQVKTSDIEKAHAIMEDKGYDKNTVAKIPPFWKWLEKLTGNVPGLKNIEPVYRFLILATIVITMAIFLIFGLMQ